MEPVSFLSQRNVEGVLHSPPVTVVMLACSLPLEHIVVKMVCHYMMLPIFLWHRTATVNEHLLARYLQYCGTAVHPVKKQCDSRPLGLFPQAPSNFIESFQ